MAKGLNRLKAGPGSAQNRPNVTEVAERMGVDRRTVARWITQGVKGQRRGDDRPLVRLRATRMPGGWVVSDEALAELERALTEAWLAPTVGQMIRTPKERERKFEASKARLIKLGLY